MYLVKFIHRLYKSVLGCIPNLLISILVNIVVIFSSSSVLFSQTDWEKYANNPILDVGDVGSWDQATVGFHSVLYADSLYHMWYAGNDGNKINIGYATSPDGVIWTKYENNPVLAVGDFGEWDALWVTCPTVLRDSTGYKMWYLGNDPTFSGFVTGYATSPDGVNWTKYSNNPVLDVGISGSWDQAVAAVGTVLFNGTLYEMWYAGAAIFGAPDIGYATSEDGITWKKFETNPVMVRGEAGSWDNSLINVPDVIYDNNENKFHMWYRGANGNASKVGYAESQDGINWLKSSNNPVLNVGNSNEWDGLNLLQSRVILEDEIFKMWYQGVDNQGTFRIGYALSERSITDVKVEAEYLPDDFTLKQNYPNPFNPSTKINYELKDATRVAVRVYSLLGQQIKTLVNAQQSAGVYSVVWDGNNHQGERVASGIYIYELKAGSQSQSRKMLLLR